MIAQHGLHGPNSAFADYAPTVGGPSNPTALWWRLGVSGARWVKLLSPAHRRVDALALRERGLRVLVRVPGESLVYDHDVLAVIDEFAGLADVLEIGNEPYPGGAFPSWDLLLWNHAALLEAVLDHCGLAAREGHLQLCAPGWRMPFMPPVAGSTLPGDGQTVADYQVPDDLAAHLAQVYNRFDVQAVHCYDPFTLASPSQYRRIDAWRAWAGNKPIHVTEYGIAATTLIPGNADRITNDQEKARRYASFVALLPGYVVAAYAFLLGGTPEFALFNGTNSYWLSDAGWRELGARVR